MPVFVNQRLYYSFAHMFIDLGGLLFLLYMFVRVVSGYFLYDYYLDRMTERLYYKEESRSMKEYIMSTAGKMRAESISPEKAQLAYQSLNYDEDDEAGRKVSHNDELSSISSMDSDEIGLDYKTDPEKFAAIKRKYRNRLSSEGLYNLWDRVERLS
mmetsp:Transcript_1796/g.2354  ORF Transcript_1796/g.2354 Transcript_1796/m.2354 type:complete len:156 (-) Transcript_1796:46-513(-)